VHILEDKCIAQEMGFVINCYGMMTDKSTSQKEGRVILSSNSSTLRLHLLLPLFVQVLLPLLLPLPLIVIIKLIKRWI